VNFYKTASPLAPEDSTLQEKLPLCTYIRRCGKTFVSYHVKDYYRIRFILGLSCSVLRARNAGYDLGVHSLHCLLENITPELHHNLSVGKS
jgi:hypothetical protein